jgi:transposase-like protein
MRDHEAIVLRREFAARERGRGKQYPAALRERATRWIRAQIAAGATYRAVASALGIHAESARRWHVTAGAGVAPAALVPVEVVAGEVVADEVPPPRTVAVISPAGFRIDGLTLAEAAALLREIG